MSKITTNTNGSYIPKWVQAACSNPRARTEIVQSQDRDNQAILIHKQIQSVYGPIQSVTFQVASAFLFSLTCDLAIFLFFVIKSGCLYDPSVKLFKAKLQLKVQYTVVAILLGWMCGRWTGCLHMLQCIVSEKSTDYALCFFLHCQPQNCSVT